MGAESPPDRGWGTSPTPLSGDTNVGQVIEKITQDKGFLLPESLHYGREQCTITVSVGKFGIGLKIMTLDSTETASIVIDSETAGKVADRLEKVITFPDKLEYDNTIQVSSPIQSFNPVLGKMEEILLTITIDDGGGTTKAQVATASPLPSHLRMTRSQRELVFLHVNSTERNENMTAVVLKPQTAKRLADVLVGISL